MSPPPAAEIELPRRPPFRQRLVVDAAALMLVLTTWLFGAIPASSVVPVPSASASATAGATQPSSSAVATQPSSSAVATQPSSSAVASDFIEFAVTADTYVYAGRPELNYGAVTELRVDADPETLTYLQFTVSGITTPVLGATLRIHALGRQTRGFQVRTVDGSWSESELTYGAQPAQGGLAGDSGLIAGEAWVEVRLTSAVAGDGQYSFVLLTTSTTALAFASREAGASTAPVLVLEVAKGPGG